ALDIDGDARRDPAREPAQHVQVRARDVEVVEVVDRIFQLIHVLRVDQSAGGYLGRRGSCLLGCERGRARGGRDGHSERSTHKGRHEVSLLEGIGVVVRVRRREITKPRRVTGERAECNRFVTGKGPRALPPPGRPPSVQPSWLANSRTSPSPRGPAIPCSPTTSRRRSTWTVPSGASSRGPSGRPSNRSVARRRSSSI